MDLFSSAQRAGEAKGIKPWAPCVAGLSVYTPSESQNYGDLREHLCSSCGSIRCVCYPPDIFRGSVSLTDHATSGTAGNDHSGGSDDCPCFTATQWVDGYCQYDDYDGYGLQTM
jgi:hypothetical protein